MKRFVISVSLFVSIITFGIVNLSSNEISESSVMNVDNDKAKISYSSFVEDEIDYDVSGLEAYQLIEDLLSKMDTSPEQESKELVDMLDNGDANNSMYLFDELYSVAEKNLKLIEDYNAGTLDYVDIFDLSVAGAVAFFKANGFWLSAELLMHAEELPDETSIYEPIHGGRILASHLTRELIEKNVTVEGKSIAYEKTGKNSVVDDLFYSIHASSVNYNSLTKDIKLNDRYDFQRGAYEDNFLQLLVNIICDAHELGSINYFYVEINTNYNDLIDMKVVSKENDGYTIRVTNNFDTTKTFVYNSKLCFVEDAANWTKLYDLKEITLAPNETINVKILNNLAADAICISYKNAAVRHITIATDLDCGTIPLELASINNYCKIIEKVGYVWKLRFYNDDNYDKLLEYNTKMCFENDAINWANLKDLDSVIIPQHDSVVVEVHENYMATNVAARILDSSTEVRLSIDRLTSGGGLRVKASKYDRYTYLPLENVGHNGGWQIKVTNITNAPIDIEYNTKMCFENDAKNWSGLKDISYIRLYPGQSQVVTVKTNWAATTVAFSYIDYNGNRIISYGNKLSKSGNISVKNSYIRG